MGYYVRAFCTAEKPPALRTILDVISSRRPQLKFDDEDALDSDDWVEATLLYKPNKLPILVECNRNDGSEECLAAEELAEFIELVEDTDESSERQQVLDHLAATKFIVACQLPTSDIDDDGHDATGEFLNYFVERSGAMVHADGEGFYQGNELILPDE